MDEIEALTQALKLERDGRAFYLQAAKWSADAETMSMFKRLAADEENHYAYLDRQRKALQEGNPWQEIPELDKVPTQDAGVPIFPKGLKALSQLPENPSLEDALLYGLGAESRSCDLYSRSARQCADPQGRAMFEKLVALEREHFDLLMLRYESQFSYPR